MSERDGRPIVIGHRGASGYRPEHTLAAYELAARLGADYLEPDVVATKDGVLVCRHENDISGTTDVADRPEFADRKATKIIDGVGVTGWFTEDFTLTELRSLRAVERIPQLRPANCEYNGAFPVATLAEVLELRGRMVHELGRDIGVYIETKHPTYFTGIGLPLEEPVLAELAAAGLRGPGAGDATQPRVYLQSFELANLRRLRQELDCGWPLVFLTEKGATPADLVVAGDPTTSDELLTSTGLRRVAQVADGIGPDKHQLMTWSEPGLPGEPTPVIEAAHDAGLVVHPWTFRVENAFLPAQLRSGPDPAAPGDFGAEVRAVLAAGVDGLFTDHPDLARQVIDAS